MSSSERLVALPVIGVTGESSSGKTTVISGLLRRLQTAGIVTAVVKHAGHGFDIDRPGSDSSRIMAAGASLVVLAGPIETAMRVSTAVTDADQAVRVAIAAGQELWGRVPDLVLIEGFRHPSRPVILVGPQKPHAVVGEVWATIPAVRQMSAEMLEAELDGLAKTIQARLHHSPASAEVRERLT